MVGTNPSRVTQSKANQSNASLPASLLLTLIVVRHWSSYWICCTAFTHCSFQIRIMKQLGEQPQKETTKCKECNVNSHSDA